MNAHDFRRKRPAPTFGLSDFLYNSSKRMKPSPANHGNSTKGTATRMSTPSTGTFETCKLSVIATTDRVKPLSSNYSGWKEAPSATITGTQSISTVLGGPENTKPVTPSSLNNLGGKGPSGASALHSVGISRSFPPNSSIVQKAASADTKNTSYARKMAAGPEHAERWSFPFLRAFGGPTNFSTQQLKAFLFHSSVGNIGSNDKMGTVFATQMEVEGSSMRTGSSTLSYASNDMLQPAQQHSQFGDSVIKTPKRINGLITPDRSEESEPVVPSSLNTPGPFHHPAVHGIIDLVAQYQSDNAILNSKVTQLLAEKSALLIQNMEASVQSTAVRKQSTEVSAQFVIILQQNKEVKAHNDALKIENFHLRDDVEYLENFRTIGIEARNRFLECQRRSLPRNPVIIEAGNRAVHGGIALTDAILFSEFVPHRRTDTRTFERLYAVTPSFVLHYRQCPRLLDVLNWRGSIIAMGRAPTGAVRSKRLFDLIAKRLKLFDLAMGEKGLQLMIAMFEERRISQAIVEMKRLVDDCHRIRWQERERERGNNTR